MLNEMVMRIMRLTVLTLLGLAAFGISPVISQNFADLGQKVSEPAAPQEEAAPAKDDLSPEELQQIIQSTGMTGMPGETSRYTLGPTDIISITVMRHPEVSGEYAINSEGKIQYEFVGDIIVAGMTKDEAKEVISQRLAEYIISPELNVKITGYNSKVVYVVGEVYNPGKIFMRGDTISVREALMQAGLPMLSGITKKSKLITPSDDGNAVKKFINVYALLYEGDLRENDVMRPGDVLYIPPTFLTKAMRAIAPIAAPIGTAAGVGSNVRMVP